MATIGKPGTGTGPVRVTVEQGLTDNLGYDAAFMSGSEIVDHTPRFIGSTLPNALVYAWDNGAIIGSTRAAADGTWSFSTTLGDGQHALSFAVGGGVLSTPFDFTIDPSLAIPVIVTLGVTDNLGYEAGIFGGDEIVDNTPRFFGTSHPDSIIFIRDAGTLIGSTVSDSNGNWSIEMRLEDGAHALTFASNDEQSTYPYEFTINTANAIPTTIDQAFEDNLGYDVAFMSGDDITDSTPRIVGTSAPEAIIYAWDYGVLVGSTVSELDGSWSITLPELAAGGHAVTFGSEPEITSNPIYFFVQNATASTLNADITELLSNSETLLLTDSDIAVQPHEQPLSLTQQDLSVESQNGVSGTTSSFTPELEDIYA